MRSTWGVMGACAHRASPPDFLARLLQLGLARHNYAAPSRTLTRTKICTSMTERDQKSPEPTGVIGTIAEDAQVRATIEQTREVLEASGAELERAKRLLRETETLVDAP